jgi:hypothetical protein
VECYTIMVGLRFLCTRSSRMLSGSLSYAQLGASTAEHTRTSNTEFEGWAT